MHVTETSRDGEIGADGGEPFIDSVDILGLFDISVDPHCEYIRKSSIELEVGWYAACGAKSKSLSWDSPGYRASYSDHHSHD